MAEVNISRLKFSSLCSTFNKAQNSKVRLEKCNYFKNIFSKSKSCKHVDYYVLLRLCVPKLDIERGAYGFQEKAFANFLIKYLALPLNSPDSNKLQKYTAALGPNISDFADVACQVLRKYHSKSQSPTISEVNERLDKIANLHFGNNNRAKETELSNLLNMVDLEEKRWLIRIILKNVKLGLSESKLLELFHERAVTILNSNNNLLKTLEILDAGEIENIKIELFSSFRPMLSEKVDKKVFNKVVTGKELVFVEKKFDGERFQLHMKDGQFMYFSKAGHNYTGSYGKNYSDGLYTPFLQDLINTSVASIILDGEMMGWNKSTNQFGSKGMKFDVKKLTIDSLYRACFVVFDVLFLNGEILTSKPLKDRRQILQNTFSPKHGILMISEVTELIEKQDVIDYFNEMIGQDEEGIIFKNPDSTYIPNERKGGWWKLKLEYFEDVMTDLDVIIMGGYLGEGRNKKIISGFLVGVAVHEPSNVSPTSYLSFAKIQSGLNNDELDFLNKKLQPYWETSADNQNRGLFWGREKPEMWIPPEKSCILIVRGSELIKVTNNEYKAPYTLRFPRIQAIHKDKPYNQCLTMNELNNLTESSKSVIKLNGRFLTLSDLEIEKTRKKRKRFDQIGYTDCNKSTNVLEGLEFCVWSGSESQSRQTIDLQIIENGGTITQVERENTFCIIVGNSHPRILAYKGAKDIVKLNWLHRIINEGKFELYHKNEIIYASKETERRILKKYDKYGDHYMKVMTEEYLRDIVKNMESKKECIVPSTLEIADLNEEMDFSPDIE